MANPNGVESRNIAKNFNRLSNEPEREFSEDKNRFELLVYSCSLSVCAHSHGRISWSIFTKIGTDLRTSKVKKEFVGVNIAPPISPVCPTPF